MLVAETKQNSFFSEQFKILRTNISFSSFDAKIKTIVITSSNMGEGKSTIASNLAFSFAQENKKVLLIDADLRKPKIHKIYNMSNKIGVSDVISNKVDFIEAYNRYYKHFHILSAGTYIPNPSELLSSQKMKNFVNDMKEIYDVVIIDTPPTNLVTDSQVMSAIADGTIVVARANKTKKNEIIKACSLLETVNAKIIGLILNDVKANRKGFSYTYLNN